MGMDLASGGHLTHGHPKITFSGKYFNSIQYGVTKDGFIDFENLEKLANIHHLILQIYHYHNQMLHINLYTEQVKLMTVKAHLIVKNKKN